MLKIKLKEIDEAKQQYEHLVKIRKRYEVDKYKCDFTQFNNPKLRDILNIFNKNDYAPISVYESNVISTSGKPLLIDPRVIIVGDFEQYCWSIKDTKCVSLVKELLNNNLIDAILSFEDKEIPCENLLKVKECCNIHKIPFISDDKNNTQKHIKRLRKLDWMYSNTKKITFENYNSKANSIPVSLEGYMDKEECGYNKIEAAMNRMRIDYCAQNIENYLSKYNKILQILTLDEVHNSLLMMEKLNAKRIPFIAYVPKHWPTKLEEFKIDI